MKKSPYKVKMERLAIKNFFLSMDQKGLCRYLGIKLDSHEEAANILIKKRTDACIRKSKEKYETSKNKKGGSDFADALCWSCGHSTNKYGCCSWSKNLTPRDDWKPGDYLKGFDKNGEISIKVIKCKGFILDTEALHDKRILQTILIDFFDNDVVNLKFFDKMHQADFNIWLQIYNNVCSLVGVAPLLLRASYDLREEE